MAVVEDRRDKSCVSDAWRGSIEIAIAKAYTAMAFSSKQQAIDSRTLGLLSRLDVPQLGAANTGTNTGPAPLFGIGDTNLYRPLTGSPVDDAVGLRHHGLVTFAGGQPVYECQAGGLLGGLGVSGDEDIFCKQMLITRRGGMPASHRGNLPPDDRDACALQTISRMT